MTPKSDLPQGTLDLLILKVVPLVLFTGTQSRSAWRKYRVVDPSSGGVALPGLHRLENRGLWRPIGRKTRLDVEAKFLSPDKKRRNQLETEAASWQRLIDAIALILGMANGVRDELVAASVATRANGGRARKGTTLPSGRACKTS